MISNYIKSKKIIDQIRPLIDEEELKKDIIDPYYYLHTHPCNAIEYYYRNLFTSFELTKLLAICKKIPKEIGSLDGGTIDENYRLSKISWVPINNETRWIYQKFTDCINEVNDNFFKYDLTRIEKLQFTQYYGNEKGFYSKHIDSMFDNTTDNRKLSVVMQLSDSEEYEGGELKLFIGNNALSIPKEKGLITFFPSHTLHECTPVTSGERYTLVGWIHGPKFR
jgi:PKHD-type hydroxylase